MKGSIILALIINVFYPVVHTHHVFVYGTLKKGQPNYSKMEDVANGEAVFLAYAQTEKLYPLVIGTEYNIPFLLNVPGKGHHVYGEIYRVDQTMLNFLDKFEECPKWYQRIKIQLKVQDGDSKGENTLKPGSIEEAFVYVKTTSGPKWLRKPTYENYDTNGDHGLTYIDIDTMPTPDPSDATQQNATKPVVYTECGVVQNGTTDPQQ